MHGFEQTEVQAGCTLRRTMEGNRYRQLGFHSLFIPGLLKANIRNYFTDHLHPYIWSSK